MGTGDSWKCSKKQTLVLNTGKKEPNQFITYNSAILAEVTSTICKLPFNQFSLITNTICHRDHACFQRIFSKVDEATIDFVMLLAIHCSKLNQMTQLPPEEGFLLLALPLVEIIL